MHLVQLPQFSCVKDPWFGRLFEACTCHGLCTRRYHGTKMCAHSSVCVSVGTFFFLLSGMLFTGLCL